eukprot:c7236_g1_i1.p1 GENE.c7236_g1_i1~~c7236_g1_i1.p1  ORF type:complete len:399 (-),score=95.55 c7236_g1_i1:72-1268(-)
MSLSPKTPRRMSVKIKSARETPSVNGTIIVDGGTGMIKAGFAGEDAPRACVPSILGWEKGLQGEQHERSKIFLGSEALGRDDLVVKHPMKHGIVHDWDAIEWLWDHVFVECLSIDVEDYYVLLTEPPMNPTSNREKMAEIMFEAFGVPGLHVGMQAQLALFSEGLTTGLVVDIGDGVTHCVPVFDGYAVSPAIMRQNLAGRDLTDFLATLLRERGHFFESSAEMEIVRDIKEKMCFVAMDYSAEMKEPKSKHEKEFILPDGKTLVMGDQRFRCPEPLFHPDLIGKDIMGLPDLITASIQKCPIDVRKSLIENIILSGGSTCFEGFPERLQHAIKSSLATSAGIKMAKPNVIVPNERKHCVFRGASVIASLSTFEQLVVTLEEYEEVGPAVVAQKMHMK